MKSTNLKGSLKSPNDISLEKVDVIVVFKYGRTSIYKVKHKSNEYKIEKTGIHYSQKVGNVLYHIFGVVSENTFLKISFSTKTLNWKLLEKSFSE